MEFYTPWCEHCQTMAPRLEELAEGLKDDSTITVAKVTMTVAKQIVTVTKVTVIAVKVTATFAKVTVMVTRVTVTVVKVTETIAKFSQVKGYAFRGSNSAVFIFVFLINLGQLLKERICSIWSKFFSLREDPNFIVLFCSGMQTGSERSCFLFIQKVEKKY